MPTNGRAAKFRKAKPCKAHAYPQIAAIAKLNSKGAAAMIKETIGFKVADTAEWRRAKALQFPDDTRNLEAAKELDQLAKEIDEIDKLKLEESDLVSRFYELNDALNEMLDGSTWESIHFEFEEIVSVELRSIGFHGGYESGEAFLRWYCDELEALLKSRINQDDGGIESPSLVEQVENDPDVKAAKQAYEAARAKALAEARKRL
jgi:hypothetical protein